MEMRIFLAHAVKLEFETEEAYLKLAAHMDEQENRDVADFFREMAGFSRVHGEAARMRAGFDATTDIHDIVDAWSGSDEGEVPDPAKFTGPLNLDDAMALALSTERHGVNFYEGVSRTATDPETLLLAEQFASEERGHVLALERFFGLEPY
jgi:rubrerythrin